MLLSEDTIILARGLDRWWNAMQLKPLSLQNVCTPGAFSICVRKK